MRKLICYIFGHKTKVARTIEVNDSLLEANFKTTYCARCFDIIERKEESIK